MGNIITVFSHKGGVGKTTLVHNVGYLLANMGKRVLLIDADPQMNLTAAVAGLSTGTEYTESSSLWKEFLTSYTNLPLYFKGVVEDKIPDAFYTKPYIYKYGQKHNKTANREKIEAGDELKFNAGQLDLLPSSIGFNGNVTTQDSRLSTIPKIEFQLSNLVSNPEGFSAGMLLTLRNAIRNLKQSYDYIFIDTSPSASSILNGLLLFSSDYFIVPAKPDFFSLQAIDNLSDVFLNWATLFRPWLSSANQNGLEYPRLLGIVPQMTKRFSTEDGDTYAGHANDWNMHINESITRFLKTYYQNYSHYRLNTPLGAEIEWFKTIFTESEPFVIQECVHFTGKLRTIAERAAIPVVFLNNAIAKEHNFPQSVFDNPEANLDNQYAKAFSSISQEYGYIADGLLRL